MTTINEYKCHVDHCLILVFNICTTQQLTSKIMRPIIMHKFGEISSGLVPCFKGTKFSNWFKLPAHGYFPMHISPCRKELWKGHSRSLSHPSH